MSKIKKLIALTLALAMVLSVSAFAGNYSENTYADADKINADCEDAVELLYALDIMVGDGKNFNPESAVTRAEMAKMIYVILNYGKDDKAVTYTGAKFFTDVPAGAWYEGYVNYCAATKLIAGRGDGKFDPTAPVTTAEAAKMILTALGYSAEARGYVGANWDKNVLADAAILGLLDGYKSNVNLVAPRQWIAVMFENALLKCWTIDTMYPSFSGLLVSGSEEGDYQKFGTKYYGLLDKTAYLYATDSAYIDVLTDKDGKVISDYAEDGWLLFSNGVTVKSSALGYMDLGQEFRVIYKDGGKTVYSIRNTGKSVVGEAVQYDVTVDTDKATSLNEAKNRYEFTIGDLTAQFNANTINCLTVAKRGNTAKVEPGTLSAAAMNTAAGQKYADLYHAVDRDADGDIDYMIKLDYSYAQIEKVFEHASYGETFTAKDVEGNTFKAGGFTRNGQWIVDDTVNSDDTFEAGNVIKVVYNPDNGKYDVEVMAVETVTYDERYYVAAEQTRHHVLGGEDYVNGKDGWERANEDVLIASNLDVEMTLVADGELIILVKKVDSDYTDLADINAQLVMVTDLVIDEYVLGGDRAYIDYMTIDGVLHEEVFYVDGKDTSVATDDANVNVGELEIHLANNMRLFVLVESGNGVYLKKLTPDAWVDTDNSKALLDYSTSLLTGYAEKNGILNTDENTFGADEFVDSDNDFFVSYVEPNKTEIKFAVLSLDDLGEGIADGSFIQGLFKTKREINTYLAGHIYIDGLVLKNATGYMYTTEGVVREDSKEDYYLNGDAVVFSNGATPDEKVYVTNDSVKANCLYAYSYEKVNGTKVYTLTLIDENYGGSRETGYLYRIDSHPITSTGNDAQEDLADAYITDAGDYKVLGKWDGKLNDNLTIKSSAVVVLKKATWENIENTANHDDGLDLTEETIEFTTFADLIAEDADEEFINYIAGGEDGTYDYVSDYIIAGAKNEVTMLYVIVHAVADDANFDAIQ